MSLIKPISTALPFYKVPNTYVGASSPQTPFYFQKTQCLQDCHFGTISDINHLPSFIIPIDKDLGLCLTAELQPSIMCASGTNETTLVPDFTWDVIGIVNSAVELALIAAVPPLNGDKYYFDDGVGTVEIYTWNSGIMNWDLSGQITPLDKDLLNVSSENFVYLWIPDPEKADDPNPARRGEWIKTLGGLQLCDIGDYTYIIYNGFKIQAMSCGLQQISIRFDTATVGGSGVIHRWMSELVDIKDFSINNNDFHKLIISHSCDLGNIPYADIQLDHTYYFDKTTLVGEPIYKIEEEKEEDGLGRERLIFKKTSKLFILDTLEVPEYIIDFLMFATQHDNCTITFPKELTNIETTMSQYIGKREIDKDAFEASNEWLETGCFGQVQLQFGLVEDIIRSSCCQSLEKEGCIISSFNIFSFEPGQNQAAIEGLPPAVGDCYLIQLDATVDPDPPTDNWFKHDDEIACWNGVGWDYTIPTDNVFINRLEAGFEGIYFFNSTNGWKKLGSVECFANAPTTITIKGFIPIGTKGQVQYRQQSASFIPWTIGATLKQSDLETGAIITGLVSVTAYEIRILTFNNNCDYGLGDITVCSTS